VLAILQKYPFSAITTDRYGKINDHCYRKIKSDGRKELKGIFAEPMGIADPTVDNPFSWKRRTR